MEATQTKDIPTDIHYLNRKLRDVFGIDTNTTQPMFRVVWTSDQYEKKLSDTTPNGLQLMYAEVQTFPKYYADRDRWVLERLVVVPISNMMEIPEAMLSYEPLWVFKDDNGNPTYPKWEPCEFVIRLLYAALGKANSGVAKYSNPDDASPIEARLKRIDDLEKQLFPNETPVGDALAYNEGVGYTGPIKEN